MAMARNDVPYALIRVIIIGVIICSVITEFEFLDAIIYQRPPLVRRRRTWSPTYHDASDLNACINKCKETYKKYEVRKRFCIDKCMVLKYCVGNCMKLFKGNKEKLDSCKKGCR
ncbi:hypothetical protein PIB30_052576 [Stylosanthes scabra]|uniref:Uncharacterized protein n=1 Tax=Stylosanthes scabra TaxID=79078 RepID=A0ABU6ZGY5_9FABA|nr:hypothetical protein [Stylosanthes scabra]